VEFRVVSLLPGSSSIPLDGIGGGGGGGGTSRRQPPVSPTHKSAIAIPKRRRCLLFISPP